MPEPGVCFELGVCFEFIRVAESLGTGAEALFRGPRGGTGGGGILGPFGAFGGGLPLKGFFEGSLWWVMMEAAGIFGSLVLVDGDALGLRRSAASARFGPGGGDEGVDISGEAPWAAAAAEVVWTDKVVDSAKGLGPAWVDEDAGISGKLGHRNSGARDDTCAPFLLFENSQSISCRRCRASSRA